METEECPIEGSCSDGESTVSHGSYSNSTNPMGNGENQSESNDMVNGGSSLGGGDEDDPMPELKPEMQDSSSTEQDSMPMITQIKQEPCEGDLYQQTNEAMAIEAGDYSPTTVQNKPKTRRKDKLLISDTNPEDQPTPDTIHVTCGHLSGILHKELFYCPGIHRACVELEDGTFVTPKKFMFMGEKARLKDWKNAIRWNGHQLRKHIEAGTLQFYKHEELCTGRCMARAPFAGKGEFQAYEKERAKLRKEKFEFETIGFAADTDSGLNGLTHDEAQALNMVTTIEENGCMKIQSVSGGDTALWNSDENTEEKAENPDIKPDVNQLQLQMVNSMQAKPDQPSPPRKVETKLMGPAAPRMSYKSKIEQLKKGHLPPCIMHGVMPPVSEPDGNDEEDRLLWMGIVELGLIDEFFREIKASLDLLKNTMVKRLVPMEDSQRISTIVRQLGLMQKLKFKLEAHKTDMDRQRKKLDREMMDLQKKVREYEMKKKLLEKRSECFDQILEIPTMRKNNYSSDPISHSPIATKPAAKTTYVLTSSGTPFSKSILSSGSITPGQVTSTVAAMGGNARLTTTTGGHKILVFPKQTAQFQTSPDGGLKITLKRKQEFSDEGSQPSKQSNTTKLEDSGNSSNTEESLDKNTNAVENTSASDVLSEKLDSSCEDVQSNGGESATGTDADQQEKSESSNKRSSRRRRSVKSYNDFVH